MANNDNYPVSILWLKLLNSMVRKSDNILANGSQNAVYSE